nr:unnamed protein product [Digitaria exilis]
MDAEYLGMQQGSSSSCRTADAASWGAAQKRQRCQGSSSTNSSLQINEPEPLDLDSGKIEEEEDYYMEDDCDDDDDGYDEDDYEFDEADFNQHLADKFDDLDLPPGVEATVPWLQKIAPKVEPKEPPKSSNADENANKYKQFKQFDTIQNFSDHYFAKVPPTEPEPGQREFNMTGNFWRRIYQHFADLVAGHFRVHGHTILAACKHYMEGNDVGSVVPEEEEEESECKSSDVGASSSSSNEPKLGVVKAKPPTRRTTFNTNVKTLYEDLLMEFNVKGADTRKFLVEKLKKNEPAAA